MSFIYIYFFYCFLHYTVFTGKNKTIYSFHCTWQCIVTYRSYQVFTVEFLQVFIVKTFLQW